MSGGDIFLFHLGGGGFDDVFGYANQSQQSDGDVGDIKLPPFETMSSGALESMVVVMPAFAEAQQGDPPAVAGVVGGLEVAVTPGVSRGVDEPGAVIGTGCSQEDAPDDP